MFDLHSHILPGIDDGARSIDESAEMVKQMAAAGVTHIIATPHYIVGTLQRSPRATNAILLEGLKSRLSAEGVRVNLYLGNEIYIDERIAGYLAEGKMATLAGGRYLLVELPLSGEFMGYKDILAGLIGLGYKVILAHPERYVSVQKDLEVAVELSQMGVLLQGNLGSLFDKYGKQARKTLIELIKRKLIFGFGTDAHRVLRADFLDLAKKKLSKYYSEAELQEVLISNPRRVLTNN